jgi:hypothetical protein
MLRHVSALTVGNLQEASFNMCSLCLTYMLEIPCMSTIIVMILQFLIVTFNHYNNNINHMWNF